MAVLLVLFQILPIAGPVGQYLGILGGKMGKDSLIQKDSIHYHIPPRDTVLIRERVSSDSVVKETLRLGNPAYIFKRVISDTTVFDTLWEERNIYLLRQLPFFDTTMVETIYKVPFSINSSWSRGLGGLTRIGDLDNTGIRDDTITFLLDSVRVTSIEDVSVPYRFIPNAYKMRSRLKVKIHGYYAPQDVRYRDTMDITGFHWYKDSLWRVKDSTYIEERFYIYYFIWMLYATRIGIYRTLLLEIYSPVAIEERANSKLEMKVPNLVRGFLPLPEWVREAVIYDGVGKKVKEEKGRNVLKVDNLPAGVYHLIIKGDGEKRILRIVKIK